MYISFCPVLFQRLYNFEMIDFLKIHDADIYNDHLSDRQIVTYHVVISDFLTDIHTQARTQFWHWWVFFFRNHFIYFSTHEFQFVFEKNNKPKHDNSSRAAVRYHATKKSTEFFSLSLSSIIIWWWSMH